MNITNLKIVNKELREAVIEAHRVSKLMQKNIEKVKRAKKRDGFKFRGC